MDSAKCVAELRKIIKYSKNCGENEENLVIFTVILMAAFGTKNVHSVLAVFLSRIDPIFNGRFLTYISILQSVLL